MARCTKANLVGPEQFRPFAGMGVMAVSAKTLPPRLVLSDQSFFPDRADNSGTVTGLAELFPFGNKFNLHGRVFQVVIIK